MKCSLTGETSALGTGKFLSLKTLKFQAADGSIHLWESVSRNNCHGAVALIATLVPSGRILLVRQFRPPANAYVWEFPAGLIDHEGENPEETAVRELYEETGYHGVADSMTMPIISSPGLSSESVYLVKMSIQEKGQEHPVPHFDGIESIETLAIHPDDMASFLADAYAKGDAIDAKVQSFVSGLTFSKKA